MMDKFINQLVLLEFTNAQGFSVEFFLSPIAYISFHSYLYTEHSSSHLRKAMQFERRLQHSNPVCILGDNALGDN